MFMATVNTVNDFLGVFLMNELTYPRLCGGTFLTLLLEVRHQRTGIRERYENKRDPFSESNTFAGLIKVIKPDYIAPEDQADDKRERERKLLKTVTSNYKNCNDAEDSLSIPFHSQPVRDIFDKLVTYEYIEALRRMQNFVDNFIDENKCQWLIIKLLGLIEADESIDDNDEFYVTHNGPTRRSKLCSQPNTELCVSLPAFLLGVWHFIVIKRQNNSIGTKTIDVWRGKFNEADKRGKFKCPDELGAKWEKKIRLVDIWIDEKNTKCIEGGDFSFANSAPHESLLRKFERVLSECQFSDFIESEPLRRFTANSELEASRLKSRYNKYVDRVCDIEITLQGFHHKYERYDEGSQIENIQYTDKVLTPTLLTMSKQLVGVLTEKIFPGIGTLDRHVRINFSAFMEALESYNELLDEKLVPKNDGFVLDSDFTAHEDNNNTDDELDCVSKKLFNFKIMSIEDIDLCEEDDDTELNDIENSYMAFHLATRISRSQIVALYNEIKDKMNP